MIANRWWKISLIILVIAVAGDCERRFGGFNPARVECPQEVAVILEPNFENMPFELTSLSQWSLWREEPRKDDPTKMTKPPYQPNGRHAASDNLATWSPFATVKAAAGGFDGVGFLPTVDDDIIGVDFDHCRCPAFDGVTAWAYGLDTILPLVADHIKELNSYAEVSPSGQGVRVFLKGKLSGGGRKKGDFEVYEEKHYFTVTGHVIDGLPRTVELRQTEVDAFYRAIFGGLEKPVRRQKVSRSNATVDGWHVLLENAFKSEDGHKIKKLWDADFSAYESQSEADLALCVHLAHWLNDDKMLMDAAFRESRLMRGKWDAKHDAEGRSYGQMTINKALACRRSSRGDRQAPKLSYAELFKRINMTEDIGILVNEIAPEVAASGLTRTEVNNLLKIIARKAGGTVDTIRADIQAAGGNNGDFGKIDHLQAAKEIVKDLCRENLAYVSTLRIFRRWDDRVWSELDDRIINGAAVDYLDGRSDGVTKNIIESITDLLRTLVFREGIIWDADTGVIPVQNGELEWKDGKWTLKPHVREHYRTTLIPVEYDPLARAPRFEKFLEEVFLGDADAVDKAILICEMIGYTLITSCVYEKFILLIGPGANGKSVLLDVIRLLIGPGQVAAVQPEQMDNRFQRAHLFGKLANIVTEIKEGGEIADAALKAITSGELTTAEHKFKKPFDFQPFSTCWFGTNHMPHTRDFSDALFRRALVVEFNRIFQEHEQDKHLKSKLADELPGILRLALEAFGGVIQRGSFTMPASCIRAKEQWRIEADQVAQFIQDCCAMEPAARVQSGALFIAYQAWTEGAGIRRTLNRINFSKRIQRLGGKPGRTSDERFFDGIRLGNVTQGEAA